ncbi:MAG: alpha/beta hydrolase [Gammaproteobacteria bacterium]|nr:alpha/beta hydrolase [Gammaproteobacteria bacterium]
MPNSVSPQLSLHFMRMGFRHIGPFVPGLAGYWACRLWFATRRSPIPAREDAWRKQTHIDHIGSAGRLLARYQWGAADAPGILLIHGWNGRGLQLGAFAAPLVSAGFRVVAFDAPGHGDSPGNSTHIFDYAQAIQTIANSSGPPLAGAIAHSFGVPAVARALLQGLDLPRLISIAAPADAEFLVQRFAKHLDIPATVVAAMRARIEHRFGMDIFLRLSTEAMLTGQTIPGLILHDRNDRDVPATHADRLQRAWRDARVIYTEGLGHNRILRDPAVIAAAVEFLRP